MRELRVKKCKKFSGVKTDGPSSCLQNSLNEHYPVPVKPTRPAQRITTYFCDVHCNIILPSSGQSSM